MSEDINDLLNVTDAGPDAHFLSEDFWAFRKMVTPILMQILFWIGLSACVLTGLMILTPLSNEYRDTWNGTRVTFGLTLIFLGPVFVRVYCEFLILFFRMNETLTEIRNKLESRAQ